MGGISGTAIRDAVFREATGEIVLCLDCHVFVVPGALKRLIDHFDANPGTRDLLQGPLLYDNLNTISTHFEPNWREGMYGTWEFEPGWRRPRAAAVRDSHAGARLVRLPA